MRDDQWDPGDAPEVNSRPATLTANPEAPRQPTRKELGKMRRQYVTIVHGTVTACGHSYDYTHLPKGNCFWCWDAFFKTSETLEQLHGELQAVGKKGLEIKYGFRLVKMFGRVLTEELTPGTYVELEAKTQ